AFVSPIIKTDDNRRLNLPINSMAEKIGFKTIQLLSTDHLPEKIVEPENSSFELHRSKFKSIFDGSSKRILREFFLLVKPKSGKKNKEYKKKYYN
ncbi:MAG: hypothetical protein ACTSPA_15440, partial [Promethearchaeota archaeon]